MVFLHDAADTREWTYTKQHANVRDECPVTFNTQFDIPLRGAVPMPADLEYKLDLHKTCLENTGTCVIDMLEKW